MTPRSVMSRLLFAANTIIAAPERGPAMLAEIVELERDLVAVGVFHLVGVDTLITSLKEIATKPLAVGGHVLRLAFAAQQARSIVEGHRAEISFIERTGDANARG